MKIWLNTHKILECFKNASMSTLHYLSFLAIDFKYFIAKFRLSNKKVTVIKIPQLSFFYAGKFVRQLRIKV